jgi:hypothetical protein
MEPLLATPGLAVRVLLSLHVAIGERRRRRIDVAALRGWLALRRAEHRKVVPRPRRDTLH